MKAKYFLFTLSFIVISSAKAAFIPKDKLEDYKNAIVLGTDEKFKCHFSYQRSSVTRDLKDLIPYIHSGYTNDDQAQPIVTLTFGIGAYNSWGDEVDLSITTDVGFKKVKKVDIFLRELISEYTNLGTIAEPKMIKRKVWKTTYNGSCE